MVRLRTCNPAMVIPESTAQGVLRGNLARMFRDLDFHLTIEDLQIADNTFVKRVSLPFLGALAGRELSHQIFQASLHCSSRTRTSLLSGATFCSQ